MLLNDVTAAMSSGVSARGALLWVAVVPGCVAPGTLPVRGAFCEPRTLIGLPYGSAQYALVLCGAGVVTEPFRLFVLS